MSTYTISEVRIEGAYPVRDVLGLSMNIGVNRHGIFTYGGLISSEDADKFIRQNAEDEVIRVHLRDELEFCGHVNEVSVCLAELGRSGGCFHWVCSKRSPYHTWNPQRPAGEVHPHNLWSGYTV